MTPGPLRTGGDRTRAAIAAWCRTLPAAAYDLRLLPSGGGPAVLRRFDAAALTAVSPWLRAMNAAGHHVLARPLAARHVLVDDLDPDALDQLRRHHRPAAVVETSKANHQAWITLGEADPLPVVASAAARLLAARFGGDPGAASAVQVGRLPGFTNRKFRHERADGSYPYVLLRAARGGVCQGAEHLLAEARDLASSDRRSSPVAVPGGADRQHLRRFLGLRSPAIEHAEAARRIASSLPPGALLDRSRADAAIARRLLERGATAEAVAAVIAAGPKAAAMPDAEAAGYVVRTMRAAARFLGGEGGDPAQAGAG